MAEVKEAPKKAKGTKVTEGIIGAASSKIVMATKSLNDAVTTALKLTETFDENALKIADQEEKLENLSNEYSNKRTQNKIDLDLAYKADKVGFANQYLTENSLVAVGKSEFIALNNKLEEWEKTFDSKVNAEIGKAKGMADSKLVSEKALLDAQFQAKEAQNIAKINNLEFQLQSAVKQSDSWEKQLNAERQASVEKSKYNSATVNVQGPGK